MGSVRYRGRGTLSSNGILYSTGTLSSNGIPGACTTFSLAF